MEYTADILAEKVSIIEAIKKSIETCDYPDNCGCRMCNYNRGFLHLRINNDECFSEFEMLEKLDEVKENDIIEIIYLTNSKKGEYKVKIDGEKISIHFIGYRNSFTGGSELIDILESGIAIKPKGIFRKEFVFKTLKGKIYTSMPHQKVFGLKNTTHLRTRRPLPKKSISRLCGAGR